MAEANVQYGGSSPLRTKRVYYGGTTPLKRGQPLCFVEDAKLFDPEASPSSATHTPDRELYRGVLVETPTTASIPHFAGVVIDGDAGKAESWVTVLQAVPGDVIKLRVIGHASFAISDNVNLTDGNAYFSRQAAFAAETSLFRVLEAVTDVEETIVLATRI